MMFGVFFYDYFRLKIGGFLPVEGLVLPQLGEVTGLSNWSSTVIISSRKFLEDLSVPFPRVSHIVDLPVDVRCLAETPLGSTPKWAYIFLWIRVRGSEVPYLFISSETFPIIVLYLTSIYCAPTLRSWPVLLSVTW